MIAALGLPEIKVGQAFADIVDWLQTNFSSVLDAIGNFFDTIVEDLGDGLTAVPGILLAVIFALIALVARGYVFALISLIAMLLIQSMPTLDLWADTMHTLALVLVASVVAVVLSIPLGILAAKSRTIGIVVRPVLDFMQTLPPFVYLIPAIVLLGTGSAPGVLATVVFSMPPGVRLTELGIRQVDTEMVEAGHAFGASPASVLTRIQLPLAMPTLMAGVNQVIMLALSMVVIAGMVGSGGLGSLVYQGITSLDTPMGFESGVSVVILAMYLDRVTSGFAGGSGLRLRPRRRQAAPA